ncbi:hypothetical protein BJY52DRAFT_1186750 [Lactarius psammicola]|nr:hypothetical protein BJY52DRAFT_1186750 [Lactarius psammicola]
MSTSLQPGIQPSKDASKLPVYSDSTYPVGPDASGEISYIHIPPLSPLSITIITIASLSIALFLWCYIYPLIQRSRGSRASAGALHAKRPVLASTRSLFGLRPKTPPTPTPTMPQLFAHYGPSDARIAPPPPALSLFRGSSLSPPSLSPTLSSSPSCASSSPMTPPLYSSSLDTDSEVIIAPVNVNIPGHVVESRTTPKKSVEHYDGRELE